MYKFAHIADTHIKNLKYHYEYRIIFKELYEKLAEEAPDFIVHCGDLAHTKTQLSPEYFELATEFMKNLADIAPLTFFPFLMRITGVIQPIQVKLILLFIMARSQIVKLTLAG